MRVFAIQTESPTDLSKTGDAADLDLMWSRATVNGAQKKVATIPRGLNRDGEGQKWWTVAYCYAQKAVIDIQSGHAEPVE